jgi:Lhr-like helicase
MKFKHQRLLDTGKAPTMEECAQFLVPDENYLPFAGSRRHDVVTKGKRKRAKHKVALPEEDIAAKRLERVVYGSDHEDSVMGMGMDMDRS